MSKPGKILGSVKHGDGWTESKTFYKCQALNQDGTICGTPYSGEESWDQQSWHMKTCHPFKWHDANCKNKDTYYWRFDYADDYFIPQIGEIGWGLMILCGHCGVGFVVNTIGAAGPIEENQRLLGMGRVAETKFNG